MLVRKARRALLCWARRRGGDARARGGCRRGTRRRGGTGDGARRRDVARLKTGRRGVAAWRAATFSNGDAEAEAEAEAEARARFPRRASLPRRDGDGDADGRGDALALGGTRDGVRAERGLRATHDASSETSRREPSRAEPDDDVVVAADADAAAAASARVSDPPEGTETRTAAALEDPRERGPSESGNPWARSPSPRLPKAEREAPK